MNSLHQAVAQLFEDHKLCKVILRNCHICNLSRNLRTLADCDTDICGRKCRGIVDAITDHDNLVAILLRFLNIAGLILRQNLGIILIHADSTRNRTSGTLAVTGHHDKFFDACLTKLTQNCLCLRAKRIFDADHGYELSADRHIQVRILLRKCIKLRLTIRRNHTLLILKYEMMASDHDALTIDLACNSVCNDVLHFRVHLIVNKMSAQRLLNDCICHRVREMLLKAGCDSEHLILVSVTEGHNVDNNRLCLGQSTRLIEDDRICICNRLHELSTLYGNVMNICLTDCRKHSEWHCKFQCAGEIYHQDRQCLRRIAGQQVGQSRTAKTPRNKGICKVLRLTLYGRLQFLGLFNHRDDSLKAGRTSCLLDADRDLSLLKSGSGIDIGTRFLLNRNGLARHRCLVYHGLALYNDTIKRDHCSDMDENLITFFNLRDRNKDLGAVCLQPYLADI